jgi:chaperonin GroES
MVKAGDKVVYKKYSTTEVKINDEEYLIISEKDILAIVKE